MITLLPSNDYCFIPVTDNDDRLIPVTDNDYYFIPIADNDYCFISFTKCSSIEFHLIHLILLNYYLVDNS